MKPIQEMASHEIANQMQIENLQQALDQKSKELSTARNAHNEKLIQKITQECSDILTQIELLNPDMDPQVKENILGIMADDLTKKLHERKN